MPGVFINYRRSDDPSVVHAILAYLERSLPPQEIFLDVEGIAPGDNFERIIDERLEHCYVLLAIIGPSWLEVTDREGRRRLELADDFVRREIARALELRKTVLPVLVRDASMPPSNRLPEDLRPLASLQAARLEHETFRENIKQLTALVESIVRTHRSRANATATATKGAPSPRSGQFQTLLVFLLFGLAACAVSEGLSFAAFGPLDLAVPQGVWRSLGSNLLAAAPFAIAWPMAAWLSGFRSWQTITVPLAVFLLAWTTTGIYWENYSPFKTNNIATDREILANLIIMAGWALYFPRLRRISYFALAFVFAVLGTVANHQIGTWDWPLLPMLIVQSICLNLPLFGLVGYAISQFGRPIQPGTAQASQTA